MSGYPITYIIVLVRLFLISEDSAPEASGHSAIFASMLVWCSTAMFARHVPTKLLIRPIKIGKICLDPLVNLIAVLSLRL